MDKKRKTKATKNASKTVKSHNHKVTNMSGRDVTHEILSIVVCALAILLIVSFLGLAGTLGGWLKTAFYWVFGGLTAWILVVLICYVTLVPFGKEANEKVRRSIYVLLFGCSISILLGVVALEKGDLSFTDYIGNCVNQTNVLRGGALGGAIAYLLKLLVDEVGSFIISIALVLIAFVLVSKHSFSQIFHSIAQLFQKESTEKETVLPVMRKKERQAELPQDKAVPVESYPYNKKDEIRFKGFKDSAPAEPEETKVPEVREVPRKKVSSATAEVPGNIAFKMKGSSTTLSGAQKEEESDPLRDVVKDMQGENAVNPLKETAREKLARNMGKSLPSANEEKGETGEDGVEEIVLPGTSFMDFEYQFPSFDLLNKNTSAGINHRNARLQAQEDANRLVATLKSFGVEAKVTNISRGPAVTRYELQPNTGVKISKIVSLTDDIAMSLAAKSIRIEAPIPGKSAVGIEIPNKEVESVFLRDVLTTGAFEDAKSRLTFCLGEDISGDTVLADVAKMPHMLIAGSTGSGKSVCINSLIISLLYKARPQELRMIMIDPKVVELSVYNGIPHLKAPVITDAKKAAGALLSEVDEMERRYRCFAEEGVRDLAGYNAVMKDKDPSKVMAHEVIIVDELADLMMVAPGDIEGSICRLAQMARAAGMHLIIATQRPSVDVITGVIKANIPSRIAFKVASQFDSRTILDGSGAEKLLGRGDMLFFPMGASEPTRIQGAFISDGEVEKVVAFAKAQGTFYEGEFQQAVDTRAVSSGKKKGGSAAASNDGEADAPENNEDKLLYDAIEMVVEGGNASASYLQRKFRIGYSRAARIIDQMEEMGVISGSDGSKARQVLITKAQYYEMKNRMEGES